MSAREGDANMIVFSVADTGIGIAAEDTGRVFEEFAQIENALQRRVKGTGLGLPLSRRLARLLGGDITMKSELGRGSVFSLVLPVVYDRPGDATAAPSPNEPRVTATAEVSHV